MNDSQSLSDPVRSGRPAMDTYEIRHWVQLWLLMFEARLGIIIIIIIITTTGCNYRAQALYKISMYFTSIFHGCGTRSFQYQLNRLGSIQPCCHHGIGSYSDTQAISPNRYPLTPGMGLESAPTGEMPCPRTQHHTAAAETRQRDLSIPSSGP